ncbi:glycosyltransferase family 22 protein [Tricholoma matsutake]|nr:glycosyltransferase family 22 protein [Tricholoma matsutake 945]
MIGITSTRLALFVRILIALSTRTFFQPDEYFQSLEPAYHYVFGYGHLTWEWLAPNPIRSIIYPALNVPLYWVLNTSGLADSVVLGDWLLINLPKVLHGTLAAATDVWVCELTRRVIGPQYVSTVLFLSLTSFFHALSLSRSLSNSLETSLTTIAFAHYPWDASSSLSPQLIFNKPRMRKMLIFSSLACVIRPTNAVIWVYLFANLFWAIRSHKRIVVMIFFEALIVGTVALVSLFILDSLYYGDITFTPFNFLLTNLSRVSLFYGSKPWHYYLSQALPILCTTALPFVLHGIYSILFVKDAVPLRTMLVTIAWSIGIYSMAGHKEWRFLHSILPLLHVFAAKSLVDLSHPAAQKKSKENKKNIKNMNRMSEHSFIQNVFSNLPPIRTRFLVFLSLTVPAALYVVLFYCSAPISVMSYIRGLPRDELHNGSFGFLMPCHSTPGHAYLHRKELAGGMWSLGCEPPLQNQDLATYRDQTDSFFDSPHNYLQTCFPSEVDPLFSPSPFPTSIPGVTTPSLSGPDAYPWAHEWPQYLVFFGSLLQQEGVRELLEQRGFREVWKKGREWEGEGHRKGGVRVWKWSG